MANTVLKVHIQQQLIDLVAAGNYYGVAYDPATNKPCDVDATPTGDCRVEPAMVHANEIDSQFVEDPRHGRADILRRVSWIFTATATFNAEATAFVAEELWSLKPPILPRTSVFRQVTLRLLKTVYEHPTRQGSHNGSRITFIFEARLARR